MVVCDINLTEYSLRMMIIMNFVKAKYRAIVQKYLSGENNRLNMKLGFEFKPTPKNTLLNYVTVISKP